MGGWRNTALRLLLIPRPPLCALKDPQLRQVLHIDVARWPAFWVHGEKVGYFQLLKNLERLNGQGLDRYRLAPFGHESVYRLLQEIRPAIQGAAPKVAIGENTREPA